MYIDVFKPNTTAKFYLFIKYCSSILCFVCFDFPFSVSTILITNLLSD